MSVGQLRSCLAWRWSPYLFRLLCPAQRLGIDFLLACLLDRDVLISDSNYCFCRNCIPACLTGFSKTATKGYIKTTEAARDEVCWREGKANSLMWCKGERVPRARDTEGAFPRSDADRSGPAVGGVLGGRRVKAGRPQRLVLKTNLGQLCTGLAMKGQSLGQFLAWMKSRGQIWSKTPADFGGCCLCL